MSKIRVQSRRERFRRCGMEFTRAGRELDTAKLDAKVLARLRADPHLVVSDVAAGKGGPTNTPTTPDGLAGGAPPASGSAAVDAAKAPAKKAPAKRAPRKSTRTAKAK